MKPLIEVFSKALSGSGVSKLEMSWSLKIAIEDMDSFLAGKIRPNDDQELVMLKFVRKNNLTNFPNENDVNFTLPSDGL